MNWPVFVSVPLGLSEVLAQEVCRLLDVPRERLQVDRTGVRLSADAHGVMRLNLHSRLAQRIHIEVAHVPYRKEDDIYEAAKAIQWEAWFTPRQRFRIDVTAHRCPLKSIHFAALRMKDGLVDRFRDRTGQRPDVETHRPDVRLHLHLMEDRLQMSVDTSGEALFKRGWREDKGDAPLKENLAAALLALSGWSQPLGDAPSGCEQGLPLFDPCCGSGTLAIEAALVACGQAPGLRRRFGFERLLPFEASAWQQLRAQAEQAIHAPQAPVFGSDVAFRMVDFARRNAERAGVAQAVTLRGGDALQRNAPCEAAGWMVLNPPYGERIEAAGVAGARQHAQVADGQDFMARLASHWKQHFAGWQAWVLSPDLELPGRMRLKASRRTPVWNGPIECRLFRFDVVAGSNRRDA